MLERSACVGTRARGDAIAEGNLLREPLRKFKPYVVGKPIEEVRREYGLTGRVAKLASNENPLGSSPQRVAMRRRSRTSRSIRTTTPGTSGRRSRSATGAGREHLRRLRLGRGDRAGRHRLPGPGRRRRQLGEDLRHVRPGGARRRGRSSAPHPCATAATVTISRRWRGSSTSGSRSSILANPTNPTGTWFTARRVRPLPRACARGRARRLRRRLPGVHHGVGPARSDGALPPRAAHPRPAHPEQGLRAGRPAGRVRDRPRGDHPGAHDLPDPFQRELGGAGRSPRRPGRRGVPAAARASTTRGSWRSFGRGWPGFPSPSRPRRPTSSSSTRPRRPAGSSRSCRRSA